MITLIQKYFPNITDTQAEQFSQLESLYGEWNAKVNVISRKDIQNLYEHHVLHSLGIAKVIQFSSGSQVMDLGTGGGFPGIPLAIMFPDVEFHLVDSIGKKVKVAAEVARSIGLKNVRYSHSRAEDIHGEYDFIVSRAVMPMADLMKCSRKNVARQQRNSLPNGFVALKGGDLAGELACMKNLCTVWKLSDWFEEDFYKEKKVVHVCVKN